jgi:hypothetical protein
MEFRIQGSDDQMAGFLGWEIKMGLWSGGQVVAH